MAGFGAVVRMVAGVMGVLAVVGCAETQLVAYSAKQLGEDQVYGTYKVGNPYQINGVTYYPQEDFDYEETGIASWYGPKFHGKPTANGEIFDMNKLSGAHRTLPMPSFVNVTNLDNGRSVNLRVNDRGPFARSRIIDVSRAAARLLGFENVGTARVRVRILADESRAIAATLQNRQMLAEGGSPITADAMPKPGVSAQSLPPPGAAAEAEAEETPALRQVAYAPEAVDAASAPQVELGPVAAQPVGATRLYVQAGAFTMFENAHRVQAQLTRLGSVDISQVLVNGQDFYRVRVGPVNSVEEADRLLAQVVGTGYEDARIVVSITE